MSWRFTWNPDKAVANLSKHGVSFEEASESFADSNGIELYDADHSSMHEQRFIRIAYSTRRLLLTIFTADDDAMIIQIISSREPAKSERAIYES